jgi:hypothetical protein
VALALLVKLEDACVLLQGNQYEAKVLIYGPVHGCIAVRGVLYTVCGFEWWGLASVVWLYLFYGCDCIFEDIYASYWSKEIHRVHNKYRRYIYVKRNNHVRIIAVSKCRLMRTG